MENELSRLCNLEKVSENEVIEIIANADECAKLAKRFLIPEILQLNAVCKVRKLKNSEFGDYRVSVKMSALVHQQCVVTLDIIEERIDEEFSIVFSLVEAVDEPKEAGRDVEFEMDEDDIEEITSPKIDLGKYIAEYLSLSLNPYPRRTDYDKDELGYQILDETQVSIEPKKENPFNVLKDLKHKT